MKKIKEITQEQFEMFKTTRSKKKMFKEIVSLDNKERYEVGDTVVKISNAKPLEIYKNTWNNKNCYYMIIETLDENLAMAFSLYSVS